MRTRVIDFSCRVTRFIALCSRLNRQRCPQVLCLVSLLFYYFSRCSIFIHYFSLSPSPLPPLCYMLPFRRQARRWKRTNEKIHSFVMLPALLFTHPYNSVSTFAFLFLIYLIWIPPVDRHYLIGPFRENRWYSFIVHLSFSALSKPSWQTFSLSLPELNQNLSLAGHPNNNATITPKSDPTVPAIKWVHLDWYKSPLHNIYHRDGNGSNIKLS